MILLPMIGVPDGGMGGREGIRRALALGLELIAGTAIEQAPSVGPLSIRVFAYIGYSGLVLFIDPSEPLGSCTLIDFDGGVGTLVIKLFPRMMMYKIF